MQVSDSAKLKPSRRKYWLGINIVILTYVQIVIEGTADSCANKHESARCKLYVSRVSSSLEVPLLF
jgi:hypothetical protein